MENKILPIIILGISSMTVVIACNKGYGGGLGWGWGEPIIFPKPTLIPKLKQAFIDGKLSVDYHKIVAPSLKPLPYKKGVGWIGKGWGIPHHGFGHGGHGYGFNAIGGGYGGFDYPIAIGKQGYLGVTYGKGYGYGGKGGGIGIGYGKGVGVLGPVGHLGGLHHGGLHGGIGHHGGLGVTPIPPLGHKFPIPHHVGHTVHENSVTVVEKGLPHVGIPHGPIGNDLYGKK